MNRRSFMKKASGVLAGVVALALPNESKKISGTRALTKEEVILLQKEAFPMYKLEFNNGKSQGQWYIPKGVHKITNNIIVDAKTFMLGAI